MKKVIAFSILAMLVFSFCKKKDTTTNGTTTTTPAPRLIFKFKFDSTQARLNAVGQPVTVPAGHAAQSPRFNGMSAHYIEMAQNDYTALGAGDKLFTAPTVTTTGTYTTAIDFDKATVVGNNQEFFSMPISQVTPGTYKWLRVSLAYQNYDINYKYTYLGTPYYLSGTLASFIGYNTFINSYKIKTQTVSGINGTKLQGYWGFETSYTISGTTTYTTSTGQAPPGSTTVVNPIFATSPIPAGSCLATGQFVNASGVQQMLTITGNETSDIIIIVSLSTNKSFEWKEFAGDLDYEPAAGDTVVDMGVRGLIPFIQ